MNAETSDFTCPECSWKGPSQFRLHGITDLPPCPECYKKCAWVLCRPANTAVQDEAARQAAKGVRMDLIPSTPFVPPPFPKLLSGTTADGRPLHQCLKCGDIAETAGCPACDRASQISMALLDKYGIKSCGAYLDEWTLEPVPLDDLASVIRPFLTQPTL